MEKVRTQVYLEREQHRWLREEARALDVSMAELLRRIVDEYARGRRPAPSRGAFAAIVGLGASDADEVAERHDEYLAEIVADGYLR